jgi:guanylate kinase
MTESSISFDMYKPQPLLVVISGPSGVGKDAVIKGLKKKQTPMHFVVTAATREPRPGEVHGVDYFFVKKTEFEEMIAKDELIEYAVVYEEYKGVPKEQVRKALKSGKDVVMRLDVQGAMKIRQLSKEAVLIFLIPENDEEWYWRLAQRNTETPEKLKVRLDTAKNELKRVNEFDYVVINAHEKLDQAVNTISAIIEAEHHRVSHRQITL